MCDVNFQILYWSKNAAVEARKLRKSGHVKSACGLTHPKASITPTLLEISGNHMTVVRG